MTGRPPIGPGIRGRPRIARGLAAMGVGRGHRVAVLLVDRLKDTIRRRRENISSWGVERTFLSHPAVAEACAVGIPSGVSGEEVLVAIVLQSEASAADLLRYSERDLPYFAVPRYVRFVKSLPKTPSSRVEKYKVRVEGVTEGSWDRELHYVKLSR